jgi:hypothetical protein
LAADWPAADSAPLTTLAVTGFPQPSRVATRMRSETVEAAPAASGPCVQVAPEHVRPEDLRPGVPCLAAALEAGC